MNDELTSEREIKDHIEKRFKIQKFEYAVKHRVLTILNNEKPMVFADIRNDFLHHFSIQKKELLIQNGKNLILYRLRWCLTELKRDGFIINEGPRKPYYITKEGMVLVERNKVYVAQKFEGDYKQIRTKIRAGLVFYRLIPISDKSDIPINYSSQTSDSAVNKYRAILEYKKQLIFYGPPGTGKTRMARQLAELIVSPFSLPLLSDQNYKQYIESLIKSWCAQHKLKMEVSFNPNVQTVMGEKRFAIVQGSSDRLNLITYKIEASDIWANVNEDDRFKIVIDPVNKRFAVMSYLEEIKMRSNISSSDKSTITIVLKKSDKNTRLSTLGADAENIIQYLKTIFSIDTDSTFPSNDTITSVTFHPSYSYGEFVEGIAPKINADKLNYEIKKGTFAKICGRAADNPSRDYVIIIDEINRGNVPSIFGEIITLLEPDKRSDKDGGGYNVSLPYSGEKFGVPPNLYVIGTMNTSDRSLVQIDVALRRRFAFVELLPNSSLLKGEVAGISLSRLLRGINGRLVKNGFEDKQIGHSYFMRAQKLEDLRTVMQYEIVPLIQDYTYDDYGKMDEILGKKFVDKENKKTKNEWIENDDVFIQGLNELAGT